LEGDIGEAVNVYDERPDIAERLEAHAARCREELGDEYEQVEGKGCREVGRVERPAPLTQYDPNHPYLYAMYDIEDAG